MLQPLNFMRGSARRRVALPLVSLALVATLAGCNAVPKVAKLDATASDFQGEWTGTYTCMQGLTGVRLNLVPQGANAVAGTFEFFPVASNPSASRGAFEVSGTTGPMGRLELVPGNWIVRAANYNTVRVSASMFTDPPVRLSGKVPDRGCGAFEATRTNATARSPLAAGAAVATTAAVSAPAARVEVPSAVAARAPIVAPITTQSAPVRSRGMKHAAFVQALGSRPLKSLVGTTLDLNLRRGGDGGWTGYIEDPQALVFFTCAQQVRGYAGGPTVSKVSALRSNDNGVFVTLDRCGGD